MQYSININQKVAVELFPELDLKDIAIIDFLHHLAASRAAVKHRITFEGEDYFWFSYMLLIEEMPLLQISNERAMKRRLDKIVEAGVLVRHPNCRELNKSYYCFTEKKELLYRQTYAPKSTEVLDTSTLKSTKPSTLKSTEVAAEPLHSKVQTIIVPNNHNTKEQFIDANASANKKIEKREDEQQVEEKAKKDSQSAAGNSQTIEARKDAFERSLIPYLEKYGKETLRAFANYWTESNRSGKKMRFEGEKFWDLSRRLGTWKRNEKPKFQSQQKQEEEKQLVYVRPKSIKQESGVLPFLDNAAQKMRL